MQNPETTKPDVPNTTIPQKAQYNNNTYRETEFYFSKAAGSNRTYMNVFQVICFFYQTEEKLNMLCKQHCYFFFIHLQKDKVKRQICHLIKHHAIKIYAGAQLSIAP